MVTKRGLTPTYENIERVYIPQASHSAPLGVYRPAKYLIGRLGGGRLGPCIIV